MDSKLRPGLASTRRRSQARVVSPSGVVVRPEASAGVTQGFSRDTCQRPLSPSHGATGGSTACRSAPVGADTAAPHRTSHQNPFASAVVMLIRPPQPHGQSGP